MSEPLFQKLINKFEGVRLDWRGLFGSDSEEIQNVIEVIREIQAAHIQYQRVIEPTKNSTHPLDLVVHGTIAAEFIRKIF